MVDDGFVFSGTILVREVSGCRPVREYVACTAVYAYIMDFFRKLPDNVRHSPSKGCFTVEYQQELVRNSSSSR